jgi:hypothetical protein
VPGAHDAGGVVDIQTHIPLRSRLRLAGMNADAYLYGDALRPGMGEEHALGRNRRFDGIASAGKGHKEGVALGIHLVAVVLLKRGTQQVPALSEHIGVPLAQLLQEARRSLDIGEEQRDGSCRLMLHGKSP